jgi:hypothetical protein
MKGLPTVNLHKTILTGCVCLATTLNALAAFAPPAEAQIEAAAGNPAALSALLKDASLEQASHVVKTVIARIAALNLSASALEARIQLTMSTTLTVVPASGLVAFAGLLGGEMGGSLAIRSQPAIVSATQGALTTGAGTRGSDVAKAFGDAYEVAASGSSNAQNTKDADKVQPPVAKLYPGQN